MKTSSILNVSNISDLRKRKYLKINSAFGLQLGYSSPVFEVRKLTGIKSLSKWFDVRNDRSLQQISHSVIICIKVPQCGKSRLFLREEILRLTECCFLSRSFKFLSALSRSLFCRTTRAPNISVSARKHKQPARRALLKHKISITKTRVGQ